MTNKPTDRGHDASKNLPEYWNLNDTYYNWAANVRGFSHVLTTVSAAPFNKTGDGPTLNALAGSTMGAGPSGLVVQGLPGRPLVLHEPRRLRAGVDDANLVKELVGAIDVGRRPVRPGLQRLRRDRARELPAVVKISRSAEPERADRLRPASRRQRPRDPDRPPRRRAPAQPGHRARRTTHRATSRSTPYSEDGMYGPEVDNNFTRTTGSTSTTPRPRSRTSSTPTARPAHDVRRPRRRTARADHGGDSERLGLLVGYFQLSRFKFVETAGGEPAHLDLASEQQILRVRQQPRRVLPRCRRHRLRQAQQPVARHGRRQPAGGGNAGGFGQSSTASRRTRARRSGRRTRPAARSRSRSTGRRPLRSAFNARQRRSSRRRSRRSRNIDDVTRDRHGGPREHRQLPRLQRHVRGATSRR